MASQAAADDSEAVYCKMLRRFEKDSHHPSWKRARRRVESN